MGETPMDVLWKRGQSLQQNIDALFLDGPSNTQNPDRIMSVRSISLRTRRVEMREAGEIETVIAQMHILLDAGKGAKMLKAACGAGHGPAGAFQLCDKVPVAGGPDILGVSRNRPGRAGDKMCIGGDRGGCVDEVDMQPPGIYRPFVRQHGRLPETAEAVAAEIMRQIAEKPTQRLGEAWLLAACPQGLQHADGLVMQIFRQ